MGTPHGITRSWWIQKGNGTPPGIARLLRAEPAMRGARTDASLFGGAASTATWQDVTTMLDAASFSVARADVASKYSTGVNANTTAWDYHFVFDGITWEFTFRNSATSPVRLFLYDLTFIGNTPWLRTTNGGKIVPMPKDCLQEGVWEMKGGATAPSNEGYPLTLQPHLSPAFRRFWKTNKIQEVFIPPGEMHVHTVKIWKHWYLNRRFWEMYDAGDPTYTFIPGITKAVCVQLIGSPVAADGVASGTVTTSQTQIHMTSRAEWSYRAIPMPTGQFLESDNLAGRAARSAGNGEIDPDTGLPVIPGVVPA